jgi:hypothetical protein
VNEREARKLLGVDADASPEQVKAAYRTRLKDWHPDRMAGNADRTTEFADRTRQIVSAYKLLSESSSPGPLPHQSGREPLEEPLWSQWNPLHPSHQRYGPNTVGDRVAIAAVMVLAVVLLIVFGF